MQIISSGLASGVLLFGFIALVLSLRRASTVVAPSLLSILNTMSILNIAFATIAIADGKIIPDRQFS